MPTQLFLRALWHPIRARILELLSSGPATRSQLVEASGGPLATVAYHSKVLCQAGCIQPAGRACERRTAVARARGPR